MQNDHSITRVQRLFIGIYTKVAPKTVVAKDFSPRRSVYASSTTAAQTPHHSARVPAYAGMTGFLRMHSYRCTDQSPLGQHQPDGAVRITRIGCGQCRAAVDGRDDVAAGHLNA